MYPSSKIVPRPLPLAAILALWTLGALAQPLSTASPESVGMSSERLSRITAVMQKEIADKKLPGAVVMVARKGKLVYSQAFGSLNNAAGGPMATDSLFRLYSMTKPLASTGLMMLDPWHFCASGGQNFPGCNAGRQREESSLR